MDTRDRDKFWGLANGNPCFTTWLVKVDHLCQRFLDQGLLDITEAQDDPYYPDHAYDENEAPEVYFLSLVEAMKRADIDPDDINRQFARMAKWGSTT